MLSSRIVFQHNRLILSNVARLIGISAAKSFRRPYVQRHGLAQARRSAILRLSAEGRTSYAQSRNYVDHLPHSNDPTIFALSTAPGRAAIAVIRISGPACKQVYTALCPSKQFPKPRYASLRALVHPHESQRVLDPGALVLSFPAPKTVTGEDVLELHVHGGQAIVASLLAAIGELSTSEYPVRYAEPGEFTRRAFYNDRLDLTQVEALGDTLSAVTEEQRRLSVQGTQSQLGRQYEQWRDMLLYARGELEALIDFSEDQHFDESAVDLASNVAAQVRVLLQALEVHSQNAMRGELLRSGIAVSLIGTPNVGKSSILNQIVGRNAAIVSKEAGTTRDIVEVGIDLGGFFCRLGDTAGLRKAMQEQRTSSNPPHVVGEIEQEGIRRARELAEQSDVVIVVFSVSLDPGTSRHSVDLDPEVVETANALAALGKRLVVVINKSDLLNTRNTEDPPGASYGVGTSSQVTLHNQLLAAVHSAIPSVPASSMFLISCNAARATESETQAKGLSTSPSALTGTAKSSEDDPGHFRAFVNGIISVFRDMTTALHPSDEQHQVLAHTESAQSGRLVQSVQHDGSLWEDSLGATARQRQLLNTCHDELVSFLDLIPGSRPSSVTSNASLSDQSMRGKSPSVLADLSDQAYPRAYTQTAWSTSNPAHNMHVVRGHIRADHTRAQHDITRPYDPATSATTNASEQEGQATVTSRDAVTGIDQCSETEDSISGHTSAGRDAASVTRGLRPIAGGAANSAGPLRQPDEGIVYDDFRSCGSDLTGPTPGSSVGVSAKDSSMENQHSHGLSVSSNGRTPDAGQAYDAVAGRGHEDEVDIVAAAEHLRAAAAALGQITGRGDVSDVEEVLGVVFEKFCVGK